MARAGKKHWRGALLLPAVFLGVLWAGSAAGQQQQRGANKTRTLLAPTIMPLMPVLLPSCPKEGVLASRNPLVFPGRSWRSMSVEQQASHPINLVFTNLAGVPSTDPLWQVTPCLYSWGIVRGSVVKLAKTYKVGGFPAMNTVALVMRSPTDVFVVFRATDDDWLADFDCVYTDDLRSSFAAPLGTGKLQLHKGFWTAYSVLDKQLMEEVNKQVLAVKLGNPFGPRPSVWFVGHSLAGALGAIAALRLSGSPSFAGEVGGVVSYGSPRVGNTAWAGLYNSRLLPVTLRFSNFRDMFAALPARGQVCVSPGPAALFDFRHVGRAALMCPQPSGLEQFKVFPRGTEASCGIAEFPSIATHLLGHYFDGWRRAYAARFGMPAGLLLAHGVHVRSVMCAECATAVKPYPLPDNKAARNDGVVSCVNTKSCADKAVFGLTSWAGLAMTSLYRPDATCDATTMTCQVPLPMEAIANVVSSVTPVVTGLAAAMMSGAAAAGAAAGAGATPPLSAAAASALAPTAAGTAAGAPAAARATIIQVPAAPPAAAPPATAAVQQTAIVDVMDAAAAAVRPAPSAEPQRSSNATAAGS